MKTYHKLPLPKNSSWDKKTWRSYTHWRIKYVIDGICNIIRWVPTIFHDRDWDDYFTLKMLQKKIEHQRNYLVKHNRYTRVDEDNYWMTVTLNLIEREIKEYYSLEYMSYMDSDIIFLPSVRHTYKVEFKTNSETLDDYLNKYPNSVKIVKKKNPDVNFNKETLAFYVSKYNQEKSRTLLFNILNQYSNRWWD